MFRSTIGVIIKNRYSRIEHWQRTIMKINNRQSKNDAWQWKINNSMFIYIWKINNRRCKIYVYIWKINNRRLIIDKIDTTPASVTDRAGVVQYMYSMLILPSPSGSINLLYTSYIFIHLENKLKYLAICLSVQGINTEVNSLLKWTNKVCPCDKHIEGINTYKQQLFHCKHNDLKLWYNFSLSRL